MPSGTDKIYVQAIITFAIIGQGAGGSWQVPAAQGSQVVIDPVASALAIVQFMKVSIGSDEIDVDTIIASPVSSQGTVGGWRGSRASSGQVVIDPVTVLLREVVFMYMVVSANKVDVDAAIASPETDQPAVRTGACAFAQ